MTEITSMEQLQALVRGGETDWKQYGEVAAQEADGLILFNYTPLAQINGRWNWFERESRGLILHRMTGRVVARPFSKFHNWGEGGRFPPADSQLMRVHEKVDGSLGIRYVWEGETRIATRGAFASPQARWATAWWYKTLGPHVAALPEWTLLFEIVYPENRIVVDYGNREELVLLAARHTLSGGYMPHDTLRAWADLHGIRMAATFDFSTPEAIVEAAHGLKDAEGWVAEFSDGSRWKFKGDEYRALHKLVSSLSFQGVLDAIQRGCEEEVLTLLPAGPLRWQAKRWQHEIEEEVHRVMGAVAAYMRHTPHGLARKDFAARVLQRPAWVRPYLFAAYDDKPLRPLILKSAFKERRDRLASSSEA